MKSDKSQWPPDIYEEYEERAAIMEYDGEMTRKEAERKAKERIRKKWPNLPKTK